MKISSANPRITSIPGPELNKQQVSASTLFCLTLVSLLLFTVKGYCDSSHYINDNIGDRAFGMAGAYTAVSDDASGCFYNPAGIVFAPGNKLSASANALQTSDKSYEGVMRNTSGGTSDWTQESFTLLPNFFGIVQKLGPGMFGISYAVPESIERRQAQTFHNIQGASTINTFAINMNDYDKSYFFGPSYAMKLSDSLSVGGTLYYHYRDTQFITNYYIQFQSGDERIYNTYRTRTAQGWQPNLGVMWEPLDNIALGLSVSRLFLTESDLDIQTIINDDVDPSDLLYTLVNTKKKDDQPLVTKFGIAWFCTPSFLISGDLKYFEEIDDRQYVLNAALGTEYYINDFIALRGGFYTDLANTPDLTSGVVNTYGEHIDIYGTSFSTTIFSNRTSITLGVNYSFGSGDSQIISGDTTIYDVNYSNLTLQIATSFTY